MLLIGPQGTLARVSTFTHPFVVFVRHSFSIAGMRAARFFTRPAFVLLMALQMLVMRSSGQLRALMQQVVEQAAAQNADPRAQEVLQRLTSPEGLAIMLTLVLVLAFFAFLMFSSLGGALGAYLIRRRR